MRALAVVLAAALALAGGAVLFVDALLKRPINPAVAVYDIEPGATFNAVARDLSSRGIVATPALVFRLYGRLTPGMLQAGEYELTPGLDSYELLAKFRAGDVRQRTITFPEGWTFREWRSHLESFGAIDHTLAELSDAGVMARLGKARLHPEGQFFPDTYRYVKGETDLSLLARAHRRMERALATEWELATRSPALASAYDALILASIVEKETGYEPDRVRIAGVFVNRLIREMRLQSDPTVIYGLAGFDGNLKRADLAAETPYNTYVIRGLPPTPICNPGVASIRATLNPEPHGFFYFVARGDGTSEFSRTLEEHNAAVARFQKAGRVKAYRSVPGPGD